MFSESNEFSPIKKNQTPYLHKLPHKLFMKNLFVLIIVVFCYKLVPAQTPQNFVLKGNVKNHTQDYFDLSVSGFLDRQILSTPIDQKGNFIKTIPITHPQDIVLQITNTPILLFAVPGDTIELNCDANNVENTLKASSSDPGRQTELNLMLALSKKIVPARQKFSTQLQDKNASDEVKRKSAQDFFSELATLALSYPFTRYSTKIFCDLYYLTLRDVGLQQQLSRHDLLFKIEVPQSLSKIFIIHSLDEKCLDETLFYISSNYRDFIFDEVRRPHDLFNSTILMGRQNIKQNYTLANCFAGSVHLNMSPSILDWYLVKAIMNGFGYYSFEGAEEAYQTFLPKIKTQLFRDTLEKFYTNVQRLKPGNEAPQFSLKNEKGQTVSLKDFKGKVVYIDFWGKYCGPCRYDIEKYIPKLHEAYKNKNVAFLNICVDVDETEWKEALSTLKLDGVNLLAEGWIKNSVCIDYNTNGIPHYVLIDQKGDMVQNNADAPWQLLGKEKNAIDQLLE